MVDLPHIEAILERQAKSWELRQTLGNAGPKAAREALLRLREGPWLSVSRQWGAGAEAIAREVGRLLGWEVYDQEILSAIAEHTHTREAVLAQLDRGHVGPFKDYISQLIVPGDPGRAAYLEQLTRVVWGLAKKGQTIILGRGANWFLNSQYGLRARIVSPLAPRVTRMAESHGIAEDEARRRILEIDHDRRAFVRQVFGRDIDDPLGYDLVLNVQHLGPEASARIIVEALRAKLSPA